MDSSCSSSNMVADSTEDQRFITIKERLRFRTLTYLLQATNSMQRTRQDTSATTSAKASSVHKRERPGHQKKPESPHRRKKHEIRHKVLTASAHSFLRDEESIAVLPSRNLSHVRVARSSSLTGTVQANMPSEGQSESHRSPKRKRTTPFGEHCLEVERLIKSVWKYDPCLACQQKARTPGAPKEDQDEAKGTTDKSCITESHQKHQDCRRSEFTKLRDYVVEAAYRRIRHRVDYGKSESGRNLFCILTRTASDGSSIVPGPIEDMFCKFSWFVPDPDTTQRMLVFISTYVEVPASRESALPSSAKSHHADSGHNIWLDKTKAISTMRGLLRRFGCPEIKKPVSVGFMVQQLFRQALASVLRGLDDSLQEYDEEDRRSRNGDSKTALARVIKYLEGLQVLQEEFTDLLHRDVQWLQQLYSLDDTRASPRPHDGQASAAHGGKVGMMADTPEIAQKVRPNQSHHLSAEASALDYEQEEGIDPRSTASASVSGEEGPQRSTKSLPWSLAARSYIDLITTHVTALEKLTQSRTCKSTNPRFLPILSRYVKDVRIEPIEYASTPKFGGATMLPIFDIITSTLPGHTRETMMAWLEDNAKDFEEAIGGEDGQGTSLLLAAEHDLFKGVCHPQMLFAALHHYFLQTDPSSTARDDVPSREQTFAEELARPFHQLPSTQPCCRACEIALNEGSNPEASPVWHVEPAWHGSWQACDMPGWMPRHVGVLLIKRAERALEERALLITSKDNGELDLVDVSEWEDIDDDDDDEEDEDENEKVVEAIDTGDLEIVFED